MEKVVSRNKSQMVSWILQPQSQIDIHGRGTGKSAGIGQTIDRNVKTMPGGITSVTGKTYSQLLTRTLPSTFKFLEQQFGYVKDWHYVIGKRPPKFFNSTFDRINKFDNVISFITGHACLLISQDRSGSGRGPNLDFEIIDEALLIDKEQYDEEIAPANRGNDEIFGIFSKNPLNYHHGFHYSSSMPPTQAAKWLLKYADYYEKEAGINIFKLWNEVVNMQIELLSIKDAEEYKLQYNEIQRRRKTMLPFVSKAGILFTLANAFDNDKIDFFNYLKRGQSRLIKMKFLIEMMNFLMDQVEDCFYNIVDERHIYYNADNDDFTKGIAENTNYDFNKLQQRDCRFDADCDLNTELELSFDWGAHISLMTVGQEKEFDFVEGFYQQTDNYINEFFVKPQGDNIMIDDLIDEFCNYYRFHTTKECLYYKDKHGDVKLANSSSSFNEQAITRLQKNGWTVILQEHRGQEPPHHEKYLLWSNALKENNTDHYPRIRFNGNNCKYSIISMKNTSVIEKDNKFKKDKRSERPSSGVAPEEATHFSDAVDKKFWTKYNELLKGLSDFIPANY
ncbi:MAG: hypothetical protein U9Q69_02675 [Nanoarchaeota archaeon]|nr:hypothetical protein [Nanoarchaeota archaeon]